MIYRLKSTLKMEIGFQLHDAEAKVGAEADAKHISERAYVHLDMLTPFVCAYLPKDLLSVRRFVHNPLCL